MNTKDTTDEKNYRDADGYVFLPDPKREIPLAVALIQQFMNRAGAPENLTEMELKMMRHYAIRIVGEIEAIQNKRGER